MTWLPIPTAPGLWLRRFTTPAGQRHYTEVVLTRLATVLTYAASSNAVREIECERWCRLEEEA